jgi:hypothetical protein
VIFSRLSAILKIMGSCNGAQTKDMRLTSLGRLAGESATEVHSII